MVIYYWLNPWGAFLWCVVLGCGWLVLRQAELLWSILASYLLCWSLWCFFWKTLANTIIFLSLYSWNQLLIRWESCSDLHTLVTFGVILAFSGRSVCGSVLADAAGRWCSSSDPADSFINEDKLQKCDIMKCILEAARLQILPYERMCCPEGFGCSGVLMSAVLVNRLLTTDSFESQACIRRQQLL